VAVARVQPEYGRRRRPTPRTRRALVERSRDRPAGGGIVDRPDNQAESTRAVERGGVHACVVRQHRVTDLAGVIRGEALSQHLGLEASEIGMPKRLPAQVLRANAIRIDQEEGCPSAEQQARQRLGQEPARPTAADQHKCSLTRTHILSCARGRSRLACDPDASARTWPAGGANDRRQDCRPEFRIRALLARGARPERRRAASARGLPPRKDRPGRSAPGSVRPHRARSGAIRRGGEPVVAVAQPKHEPRRIRLARHANHDAVHCPIALDFQPLAPTTWLIVTVTAFGKRPPRYLATAAAILEPPRPPPSVEPVAGRVVVPKGGPPVARDACRALGLSSQWTQVRGGRRQRARLGEPPRPAPCASRRPQADAAKPQNRDSRAHRR
jgi:hypothetical protein